VPVLVIGNLIVGGAGKTPSTIAIVQALRRPDGGPAWCRAARPRRRGRAPWVPARRRARSATNRC
jgi:tetraacyldisaccharide-1-P 4'-kinase